MVSAIIWKIRTVDMIHIHILGDWVMKFRYLVARDEAKHGFPGRAWFMVKASLVCLFRKKKM